MSKNFDHLASLSLESIFIKPCKKSIQLPIQRLYRRDFQFWKIFWKHPFKIIKFAMQMINIQFLQNIHIIVDRSKINIIIIKGVIILCSTILITFLILQYSNNDSILITIVNHCYIFSTRSWNLDWISIYRDQVDKNYKYWFFETIQRHYSWGSLVEKLQLSNKFVSDKISSKLFKRKQKLTTSHKWINISTYVDED